ncbi:hypothetical protein A3C89_01295 [Candidatus Kaiserbacteria bacterium RIFCSPHIGHO2_02_FULL_50_50]|uniref:Uncharacterized protein n=1 Tax=Candidatus Kaiserbacteria bacterium RIFCSPHIGHO2_02_FULL_50_50 TaxID=1798492 RepID=A0A1F6DGE1_9BACT|nr:MAG: hypothetical protein A3C89_01295 [Candidatus Kaiserbacteria bacterium RIFCSPHIGHO2_02_FULL_50_50]OGG88932.1 MAG: hypothetical protein A3G62_02850 [Candidatus Kaiserbacteria bacterium RIFCSPLOWO2_12_FULL_50_10]
MSLYKPWYFPRFALFSGGSMNPFRDLSQSVGCLAYAEAGNGTDVHVHVSLGPMKISALRELAATGAVLLEADGDTRKVQFTGKTSSRKLAKFSAAATRIGYPLIRSKLSPESFERLH